MAKDFLEMMEFRHACKIFDESKRVSDEDMRYILEAGRLSPSSFGQEGWKFLVVRGKELKEALKPFCWNQVQLTTCSFLVVILAAIENLKPQSGVVRKRFERRDLPKERIEAYIQRYSSHLKDALSSDEKLYCWSARQTYIALANMMNAAASIGIDSCAIEGLEKEKVEALLGIDTKKWQLSVICTFGYRVKEPPKKVRLGFNEVVEFVD